MKLTTFTCRCNGSILLLKTELIERITAERNSVRVHAGQESFVLKTCLDRLEEELGDTVFIRIHRSTIVNVDHIRELRPWLRGRYRVIMRDGTQLILSRNYRDHFFKVIGKPLG
jgi:two-component system, LytTR family, response regulator